MSIEQQIQECEDHITRLEQLKRATRTSDDDEYQAADRRIIDMQISRINRDLDESYQQMAVLKIRRMMGY